MLISKQSIVSNLWCRSIEFKEKGDIYEGHKHTFDHQHLLAVGSVRVRIGDDVCADFNAPCFIFIEKDSMHSIEALSDYALGYCVHPIRSGNRVEDIYDPADNPKHKDDKVMMTYEDGEKSVYQDSPVTKWEDKDAEL